TPDKRRGLETYRQFPNELQGTAQAQWQMLWDRLILEDPGRVLPDVEALWRKAPPGDPIFPALLVVARARAGNGETAELEHRILSADRRLGHFPHVYQFLAEAYAQRQDPARAVEYLRRASETGLCCPLCLDKDPLLDPIRSSRAYRTLREE